MSLVHFLLEVIFLVTMAASCHGYMEVASVLRMLNIPWEGDCPVTPALLLHPQLDSLGWVGRCPTVYRVAHLPPSYQPSSVLEGFCDPRCHGSPCGSYGDFRCKNYTVPIQVSSDELAAVRTAYISVACVCQFQKSVKLREHIPRTVD